MLPINEIVARITGMNKKLLTDTRETGNGINEDTLGGMSCPSPIHDIRAATRPRHFNEDAPQDVAAGGKRNWQYELPDAQPSQDQKVPQHRMPKMSADKDIFDVDDQDDSETEIGQLGKRKAVEGKKNSMKNFMKEYIGSMDSFRNLSGLLTEDEIPVRAAHSGQVPTPGVNKANKMPAGSAGLEGEPLQPVEPAEDDKSDVGDDEELTLDGAIAMLKKEGIDTDELWVEFLEQRGIGADVFEQLVAEAMEGGDVAEMDQLLALEGIFLQVLPRLLPEGLRDLFGMKKKAQPDVMAPVKAAVAAIKTHGAAGVRAANAHGVAPQHVVSMDKPKYNQDFNSGNRSARAKSATRKMAVGESKEWKFKTHHNAKTGKPHMPWHPKMEGLAEQYGLQTEGKKWIGKMHMKKGALHKELGVPQGKKIPAGKLAAAAKAGGKEGKRARLAQTLKKLHK